nr:organic cation transporter protein-like isoform X1 [Onthophagus taurus]
MDEIYRDEDEGILEDLLRDCREMNPNQNDAEEDEDNDVVTRAIGSFGKWQLQMTFLLSLFNIPCTFHIYSPTFLANQRKTWCARPEEFQNISVDDWITYTQPNKDNDGHCWIYDLTGISSLENITPNLPLVACKNWEFEGGGTTIIEDFSLVCNRRFLNNISEMMFLAGVAIGGLVCGFLSDKFGRKKTLMFSVCGQTALGILIAFSPWFELYCILRALLGFISVSVVFSGFVLSIELVSGRWRTISGLAYFFPLSLGYAITAGIAWLLRDWRHFQLAISVPGILFMGLYWIIPKSPRWLLAMGKTDEVIPILQRAAKINGRTVPDNLEKLMMDDNKGGEEPKVSVWDLFKTREMTKTTILLSIIWFVVYLIYYGITLNMQNIGGDIYINSVVSGLVEIPAIALSIGILLKMGRRYPFGGTIFFAGIISVCIIPIKMFIPDLQWPVTALAMIGKFLISSSNAVMPVFTAELYPTTMRNLGVGASNVSAGIALMLVPFVYETEVLHVSVPLIILGVFGVVGGVSVLFLRETGNKPLKDTL